MRRVINLPLVMMAIIVVVAQSQFMMVQAQAPTGNCASSLASLNVCAQFVVPGANPTPNSECCGALQSVPQDCLCNTLRIAARFPARCNLPTLNCGI